MQARMKKHHTEKTERYIPSEYPISADAMIKKICGDLPEWAVYLRGLRYREDLTQIEMGRLLNIPQGNISQMEHGKRPIGKRIAKKLAKLFKTDYHLFL